MKAHLTLLLAWLVGLTSACDDGVGPSAFTGARITTATTGLELDPNGYRVAVDGNVLAAMPVNDVALLPVEPGRRTIAITDLSPNCTIEGPGTQTVTIVATEITPIEFAVVCTATSGVIGVIISGSVAGAVHQATVDSGTPFPVGPGDRVYLEGISAGAHVVSLNPSTFCSAAAKQQVVTVTVGHAILDTVEVTFSVTCVAPPTRARIAFVRMPQPLPSGQPGPGTPDIYIANADGSGAARLTNGQRPAWSPDGRRIAFYRDGMVNVIDVDGSNERALAQGGNPAWSPDGTQIVFNTGFGTSGGIFVINVDGSGLTHLIRNDFARPGSRGDWTGWPEWSPDGRISFVRTEPDNNRPAEHPLGIYITNADGSDPRFLVSGWEHTWSPDGSRIAGVTGGGISSVDSNGGDPRVHYDNRANHALNPDWSPDGRSIVFDQLKIRLVDCDEPPACPRRIFIVSTEGGPARQLIPELEQAPDYWDVYPAWARVNE